MSETTQIHPDKVRAYLATDYRIGLRMVSVDTGPGNDNKTPAPNLPGKVDCPLCLSLHFTGACLPGKAVVPIASASRLVDYTTVVRTISSPLANQQLARAPPLIA